MLRDECSGGGGPLAVGRRPQGVGKARGAPSSGMYGSSRRIPPASKVISSSLQPSGMPAHSGHWSVAKGSTSLMPLFWTGAVIRPDLRSFLSFLLAARRQEACTDAFHASGQSTSTSVRRTRVSTSFRISVIDLMDQNSMGTLRLSLNPSNRPIEMHAAAFAPDCLFGRGRDREDVGGACLAIGRRASCCATQPCEKRCRVRRML